MVARIRSIHLCAVLLALSACAGDEEPDEAGSMTTRDEVLEACLNFEAAACRKGASCRGEDEAPLDLCLLQAEVTCNRQVDQITCWDGLAAGYEDCLELEDAACEDLCDEDGVCVFSCTFECPEATAAG